MSYEGPVSVNGNFYSAPNRACKLVLKVQRHPLETRAFEDGDLVTRRSVLEGRNRRHVDSTTAARRHRWPRPVSGLRPTSRHR